VLDGVQHAVRVFAFDLKFERFSHARTLILRNAVVYLAALGKRLRKGHDYAA
jgi:hypothetical protein